MCLVPLADDVTDDACPLLILLHVVILCHARVGGTHNGDQSIQSYQRAYDNLQVEEQLHQGHRFRQVSAMIYVLCKDTIE